MTEPRAHHPVSAWASGAVLGERYELVELVGAGGVAEVWRGKDLRLGRDVAVKLLSGPAAGDPAQRARVEREARALAALDHPNVVRIFDYGEQPRSGGAPLPYLVMEYVDGPDLAGLLAAEGALPVPRAVALMDGVLRGVAEAHAIGIIHGDLKPGNVLLARREDGWEPKVGDFGVARVLAEETGTTLPVATPAYAPPEVLRGERPSQASDVYSAGCIAFEVLTGRRPFGGRTIFEATQQHLESPPPDLGDVEDGETLQTVIHRAMAKHPSARFPTAGAFAGALTAALPAAQPQIPSEPPPGTEDTLEQEPPSAADDTQVTTGIADDVVGAPDDQPTVHLRREPTVALPGRARRSPALVRAMDRIAKVPPGLAIAVAAIVVLLLMRGTATATVKVPDLVGKDTATAVRLAEAGGFRTTSAEVQRGGRAGTVVGQQPPAGSLHRRGSTITLEVTTGANQVVVPDVASKTVPEAAKILADAKLTVSSRAVVDLTSDAPAGTVLGSRPPAGAEVDEGSEIELIVPNPGREQPREQAPAEPKGKGKGGGKGQNDD